MSYALAATEKILSNGWAMNKYRPSYIRAFCVVCGDPIYSNHNINRYKGRIMCNKRRCLMEDSDQDDIHLQYFHVRSSMGMFDEAEPRQCISIRPKHYGKFKKEKKKKCGLIIGTHAI